LPPLEEWDLGQTAADSLARIGPAAVPALLEVLRSPDPKRRARAARVLARMGPLAKEAAPSLVAALHDPDPQVRIAAARALGQIGPEAAAAVPALVEAMLESETAQPAHDP
jgi:HEAT repeat protein